MDYPMSEILCTHIHFTKCAHKLVISGRSTGSEYEYDELLALTPTLGYDNHLNKVIYHSNNVALRQMKV